MKEKIIKKPWGTEILFACSKKYAGKLLLINKGAKLSKQFHRVKHETLYAYSGDFVIEINNKRKYINEKEIIVLKPKTIHRICADFNAVLIIEVSTPELKDIVRLKDDYNRIKNG